ncbi:MAG: hypothetical protein Q7T87_15090 [Polaromonas sp.]|nr:hypothetical protein [Polaromonas sp.]
MANKKQDNRNDQKNPQIADDGTPLASGHGGKVENDFNQAGEQKPTQKNEAQRTANSRHDRESHVGGSNQLQSRRGGPNSGH